MTPPPQNKLFLQTLTLKEQYVVFTHYRRNYNRSSRPTFSFYKDQSVFSYFSLCTINFCVLSQCDYYPSGLHFSMDSWIPNLFMTPCMWPSTLSWSTSPLHCVWFLSHDNLISFSCLLQHLIPYPLMYFTIVSCFTIWSISVFIRLQYSSIYLDDILFLLSLIKNFLISLCLGL